ncbi:S1C family serine protease [Nocardioides ultimimeridianus]
MSTLPPYGPPSFPPPSGSPLLPPQRPAPSRGRFAAAVLTGALVVGGTAGVGGAAAWNALDGSGPAGSASTITVDGTPVSVVKSGSVEAVAKAVLPSVVEIDVEGGGSAGSGSGVVLNKAGMILTNNHVVTLDSSVSAQSTQISVSFNDGTKVAAKVVGTDPLTDTAVIQVSGVSDLTPVTVGRSDNLQVGQQVVAIGSPYGLSSTVTSGIVSALDRPVDVGQDSAGNTTAYPAIQTDAAINPGNSGGALVDMAGHLVGINASIQTASDSSTTGGQGGSIGLGFAIPIDEILPVVEQLENGQTPTHAKLGIQISDVPQQGGQSLAEVTDGARIREVTSGSAAGSAGLRSGDIITGIDDHKITSADSLIATIRAYRPGDQVKVTYERGGKTATTELKLGSDAGSNS